MSADKLHITLAGREHVVEAGTTAGDAVAGEAGADGEVIAAQVNGAPRDLAHRLSDGDAVEPIGIKSAAGLAAKRVAGRRARFHHMLATGESDMKLVGRHG